MQYSNYSITISARQGTGYPVSAVADGMGRVSGILPDPPTELTDLLAQVAALPPGDGNETLLVTAGVGLFRWLTDPVETHLRVAWDRVEQQKSGLRVLLSIDPPEINAWPWELLHDPERGRTLGTSIATPLVRYLDRSDQFGSLADLKAELPLDMLLVLPKALDLNLVKERAVIEQAVQPLDEVLSVHVLDGVVTRARFADALISGGFEIVHGSGHGAFLDGQGYISLNLPDGAPDWVDEQVMGRFVANCRSLKLAVLNVCSSGRVDEGRGFQGLAPQLVRDGVPAVIAMQYPLSDDAAMTFAEEFYRRLCVGENAGRVDVAVSYARNMLAILYPGDRCLCAPVVYTHAPDGVIFTLQSETERPLPPESRPVMGGAHPLLVSLQESTTFQDSLNLADRYLLADWRQALSRAAEAYQQHLDADDAEAREAAQRGLALVWQRIQAIDSRIAQA